MKVKDLIKELKKEDPNRVVVMASDSEGNSYSPLADFWLGSYEEDTTWYGKAGIERLTKELKKAGYSEEDVVDGKKAIILCPVK